ncbi:MAG: hypothetical protein WCP01_12580 [Methylococcaceae bacterium]|jgi:hypothetical protein
MKRNTAPKISPEFGFLIAGTGFDQNEELSFRLFIEEQLLKLTTTILTRLKAEVALAELIFGEAASARTQLRILSGNYSDCPVWASFIAERLDLPLHAVYCGSLKSSKTTSDLLTERLVALSPIVANDVYLSQEQIIQEDTLKAFSDILLWLGDIAHDPLSNRSLTLLRDTILEGKPVIWLQSDKRISILDYRLLDEPHRVILSTSHDCQTAISALFVDYDVSLLTTEIRFLANPLHSYKLKAANDQSLTILREYFTEQAPNAFSHRFAGRIDKSLGALIHLKGMFAALFSKTSSSWYGVNVPDHLVDSGCHIEEPTQLWERFTWSDQLANVAAGFHRDVTWCLYLLSSFAVFAAVAGVIQLGTFPDWFWPVTELIAIGVLLISYSMASRLNLHGKWLFHRFIAEQIRYTRLGLPLLTFQAPLLAPLRNTVVDKNKDVQIKLMSAETWLFKRTVVASGLPHLAHDPVYQPDKICHELRDYVVGVIKDQCSYHQKTHKTLHAIEHRLHWLTKLAFIMTGLAVIGHFVIHAQWLLIFTAAMPALAAAIHGIVTMNEMGRVSQMSNHTHHQLTHLLKSISRLDALQFDDARFLIQLRNITHESASVMSNVNRQWQDLIEHQTTSLPA